MHNEDGRRFRAAGRFPRGGNTPDKVSRGLAAADYDNDGDMDLLVRIRRSDRSAAQRRRQRAKRAAHSAPSRGPALPTASALAWSRRSDRETLVREVKAGSSYLSQSDTRVQIGLDQAAAIERLEVHWPRGIDEVFRNVAANQILTIREGNGISRRGSR